MMRISRIRCCCKLLPLARSHIQGQCFVRGDAMRPRLLAVLTALVAASTAAPGDAQTPKPDPKALAGTGILERLAERTGVYGVPPTAKVPGFVADAGWPQK